MWHFHSVMDLTDLLKSYRTSSCCSVVYIDEDNSLSQSSSKLVSGCRREVNMAVISAVMAVTLRRFDVQPMLNGKYKVVTLICFIQQN